MLPVIPTSILGIVVSIMLPSLVLYCIYVNPRYRFNENTLSYLGSSRKTRWVWRPTIAIGSIFFTAFLISIINILGVLDNVFVSVFVILSGVFMLLIPLTHHNFKRNRKIRLTHNVSSGLFITITSINIIIIQLFTISISPILGVLGLIMGIIILVGTPISFIKYKITSLPELFFFLLVCLWAFVYSVGLLLI